MYAVVREPVTTVEVSCVCCGTVLSCGHAVLCCVCYVGDEDFLVLLSETAASQIYMKWVDTLKVFIHNCMAGPAQPYIFVLMHLLIQARKEELQLRSGQKDVVMLFCAT